MRKLLNDIMLFMTGVTLVLIGYAIAFYVQMRWRRFLS